MYVKNPERRPQSYHILQGMIVSVIAFSLTGFINSDYIFFAWAVVILFDFLVPMAASGHKNKKNTNNITNPSHLQERLGLFVLLVL